MPRTLPWLTNSSTTTAKGRTPQKTATPSKRTPTNTHPHKRQRLSPQHSLSTSDDDLPTAPRSNAGLKNNTLTKGISRPRSPSTSPPPPPPDVQTMIPSDEAWIMVEDEFYSTAQRFTQHLHHAEYQRLKTQAARRAASAASLPVPGLSTDQRQAAVARVAHKQGTAVTRKGSEEIEEGEDLIIGDRNLADLMQGTSQARKERARLEDLIGTLKTRTRAAAGLERQSHSKSRPSSNSSSLGSNNLRSLPASLAEGGGKGASDVVPIDSEDDDDLDAVVQRGNSMQRTPATEDVDMRGTASAAIAVEQESTQQKRREDLSRSVPTYPDLMADAKTPDHQGEIRGKLVKIEHESTVAQAVEDVPKRRPVLSRLTAVRKAREARKAEEERQRVAEAIPIFIE